VFHVETTDGTCATCPTLGEAIRAAYASGATFPRRTGGTPMRVILDDAGDIAAALDSCAPRAPLKGKAPADPSDPYHSHGAYCDAKSWNSPAVRAAFPDSLLLAMIDDKAIDFVRWSRSSAAYRRAYYDRPVIIAAAMARGIWPRQR
jgi:hypothetical protein